MPVANQIVQPVKNCKHIHKLFANKYFKVIVY